MQTNSDIRWVCGPFPMMSLETGMRGNAILLAFAAVLLARGAAASADTLFDLAGAEPYRFPLPLPAGFRLSGGVAVDDNKITVNALANGTGTVTINRITWSEGGSMADNRPGFKDLAPYAGLGYTKSFGGAFKVNWDAGALFGAMPVVPRPLLPDLPESLALPNDYMESHGHAVAVAPTAQVTVSLKF
jgi:hypothetical protein